MAETDMPAKETTVTEIAVTDLSAMQREANEGLMVRFINDDLVNRASLDVRASSVFYDPDRVFRYVTESLPAPESSAAAGRELVHPLLVQRLLNPAPPDTPAPPCPIRSAAHSISVRKCRARHAVAFPPVTGDAAIEMIVMRVQPGPERCSSTQSTPVTGQEVPAVKVAARRAFCFRAQAAHRDPRQELPAHNYLQRMRRDPNMLSRNTYPPLIDKAPVAML
jgi:hypothetical protein